MVTEKVSPIVEEYLEQIYRLEKSHKVARTKQLAERVGVSLGTVTNTIEGLKQKQLVTHEPYKGVKLTTAGRKIALNVLRDLPFDRFIQVFIAFFVIHSSQEESPKS